MRLPRLRQILPRPKSGMSAAAKVLMVALPVAAFVAGSLFRDYWEGYDDNP